MTTDRFHPVIFKYRSREQALFPFLDDIGYEMGLQLEMESGCYFGFICLEKPFSEN